MGRYHSDHLEKYDGKYQTASWQNYRFDLVMVLIKKILMLRSNSSFIPIQRDKSLLGYFTDNELPWYNNALDKHLTLLAKDEQGYLAAKRG
jgi:hypothetical protein